MSPGQAVLNLTLAARDVIRYDASMFISGVDRPIFYPGNQAGLLNERGVDADNAGASMDMTFGHPAHICLEIATLPGHVRGATRRRLFDHADSLASAVHSANSCAGSRGAGADRDGDDRPRDGGRILRPRRGGRLRLLRNHNAESEASRSGRDDARLLAWGGRPRALARCQATRRSLRLVRPSCGLLARLCQNRRNR
jgi:hypothetical protein